MGSTFVKIYPIKNAKFTVFQCDFRKKNDVEHLFLNIKSIDVLINAKEFLKKELKSDVFIFDEDNSNKIDPKGRAILSKPYRPAIFVE